ncbi:putative chromate transport protein [Clostridium bornimense]|uniref:Putative chromate transport protein n=1 Tax=Clostridium bornimense TaxID=1216932 RepID=W6SEG8_9CLOT|nr:chromate transporter [Clostridium bornimense]CDM68045.1 putative chromate transport protein [Clostridium bornimense]
MNYIKLFLSFLKIGTFSFGGGYAMLPFIQKEVVEKNQWITMAEFTDIIGISQMTPGPVSINSATFIGYRVGGILGSIVATIGIIFTSFILVLITSKAIKTFKDNPKIKGMLMGMRPALIALILTAFLSLAKEAYVDFKSILITVVAAGFLFTKKLHPILVIVLSAY